MNSKIILTLISLFHLATGFTLEVPIYDFPLSAYSQDSKDYFPKDSDYDKPLLSLSYQNRELKQFFKIYYATGSQGFSPWAEQIISASLNFVAKKELEILNEFSNENKALEKRHFGENFKEKDALWWNNIKNNMDLDALSSIEFREDNRAIAVTNTFARALPDIAPDFHHPSIPGEGFPFDNLQESAIWAGTPLYVYTLSKDKAWSLVYSADGYIAWVKSADIAYVSPSFIHEWQSFAHKLIAITKTEASIVDSLTNNFRFTAYLGSVFPMLQQDEKYTTILIPIKSNSNQALIKTAKVDSQAVSLMPLAATPRNFVKIINELKSRPYGWGGAYFYNDCSQEMKSIFTAFGIWLPRNSSQQAKLSTSIDLSDKNVDERLKLLKEKGRPLLTIIYIGGHVMLYIGTKDIPGSKNAAISYQNVWALRSQADNGRYVIGQSVFFPLLKEYPESMDIKSQVYRPYFKLIFLDELNKSETVESFVGRVFSQ